MRLQLPHQVRYAPAQYRQRFRKGSPDGGIVPLYAGRVGHAPMGAHHLAKVHRARLSRRVGAQGYDHTGLFRQIIPRLARKPIGCNARIAQRFKGTRVYMVEGAARQKTPNEIALNILLVALTVIFVLVTATLWCFARFAAGQSNAANPAGVISLVALFVCLAPTTIGALLSSIGIAGMSRLNQANVLAMSGRAIEAAGDVDVLLLDKTGTITLGNRLAVSFMPVDGHNEQQLAEAARLASLADETPEGRSIVLLADSLCPPHAGTGESDAVFVPFSAHTRMGRIRNCFVISLTSIAGFSRTSVGSNGRPWGSLSSSEFRSTF